MPGVYTEADYENSVIELFKNMGYTYVYGPDLVRDFRSPLYDDVLVDSLHRLNRNLPEDATEKRCLYGLSAERNPGTLCCKR